MVAGSVDPAMEALSHPASTPRLPAARRRSGRGVDLASTGHVFERVRARVRCPRFLKARP